MLYQSMFSINCQKNIAVYQFYDCFGKRSCFVFLSIEALGWYNCNISTIFSKWRILWFCRNNNILFVKKIKEIKQMFYLFIYIITRGITNIVSFWLVLHSNVDLFQVWVHVLALKVREPVHFAHPFLKYVFALVCVKS